jgi:hypothetical protein
MLEDAIYVVTTLVSANRCALCRLRRFTTGQVRCMVEGAVFGGTSGERGTARGRSLPRGGQEALHNGHRFR